jgi:hypothetical protein
MKQLAMRNAQDAYDQHTARVGTPCFVQKGKVSYKPGFSNFFWSGRVTVNTDNTH